MDMEVVSADGEYTHISLSGRINLKNLEGLDVKFTTQTVTRKKPVIVDLSGVDFMASIGLRMLVTVAKSLARHDNAKMVLLNPQPNVEDVLTTSGFDLIMPIVHDFDSAVKTIKNP